MHDQFWKFRDQIMGVVVAQDPGPGKPKTKINESNTYTYPRDWHLLSNWVKLAK
jgi:hypothetical protein